MDTSADALLKGALTGKDRFEAVALIHLNRDHLLFLDFAAPAPDALSTDYEALLLRAATDTEALESQPDEEDVRHFTRDGTQIILLTFRNRSGRYLLSALVAPRKSYKQVIKRLTKSLKTALK